MSRFHQASVIVPSPIGPLGLSASPRGLTRLDFLGSETVFSEEGTATGAEESAILAEAARQLEAYFAGSLRQFELPLDLSGTAFQQRAWQAIGRIPFGELVSYAEIAATAGNPKAYRAAGAACGANPVAIVIPCHRVVGSDKGLHGFGGGLDVKRWLLAHEGVVNVRIAAQPRLAAAPV